MKHFNTIQHHLFIQSDAKSVFNQLSTIDGLNRWWSKDCKGDFNLGNIISLNFGPDYLWEAKITKFENNKEIEFTLISSDEEWLDTKVNIKVEENQKGIWLKFAHRDWKDIDNNFPITSYCWAIYLRLIKVYLETGHTVEYSKRLDV